MPNDHPDDALASVLGGAASGGGVSRDELRARTGVPDAVLDAAEREGFLTPSRTGGGHAYTEADVDAVAAGMTLVDAGVPLGELLALARHFDAALGEVAEEAVEIFARFVRDPVLAETASSGEAGARLVEAFEHMLPATSAVVAHRFQRLLVARALARVDRDPGPS